MPWAEVHWYSNVLEKQTTAQVLLPVGGKPPFATLYLLHGLTNDSTSWLRNSRIEFHVRELPLIVVMPDGYRGFYTDNAEGPAYARHIGEELPAFIERNFHAKPARAARAVGGHSMGGYGALRIGLGYADRFCSAHSHSGALMSADIDLSPGARQTRDALKDRDPVFIAELRRIFGERPQGTAHDLLELARKAKQAKRLPKLLLDCGTDDFLLGDNRAFHAALKSRRIPHVYREFPGAHTWDYWDVHIREALAFHAKNLRLPAL